MIKDYALARRPIRLRADHRGVTAVEFAIVGPLFLFLCFLILRLGLLFFTQVSLDAGLSYAARQLQISQILPGGVLSQQQFRAAFCSRAGGLLTSCLANGDLHIRVVSGPLFTPLAPPAMPPGGVQPIWQPGAPGNDVVAQVSYVFPGILTFSTTTLLATTVIENEPN